jgi:hypothetical protein
VNKKLNKIKIIIKLLEVSGFDGNLENGNGFTGLKPIMNKALSM